MDSGLPLLLETGLRSSAKPTTIYHGPLSSIAHSDTGTLRVLSRNCLFLLRCVGAWQYTELHLVLLAASFRSPWRVFIETLNGLYYPSFNFQRKLVQQSRCHVKILLNSGYWCSYGLVGRYIAANSER